MKQALSIGALLLVGMAGTLGAQTANVIELEPADAAHAKEMWINLIKAQDDWMIEKDLIYRKYATSKGGSTGGKSVTGFDNGFEFSKDFKFIVPMVANFTIDHVDHSPNPNVCSCLSAVNYYGCTPVPCVAY